MDTVEIPPEGRGVHLQGYGWVKVFRTVSPNGGAEYWATNGLELTRQQQEALKDQAWGIETYHRGLKQCCGVEKCQARKAEAQRCHIGRPSGPFCAWKSTAWAAASVGTRPWQRPSALPSGNIWLNPSTPLTQQHAQSGQHWNLLLVLLIRHSGEGQNPGHRRPQRVCLCRIFWIPAKAGMTVPGGSYEYQQVLRIPRMQGLLNAWCEIGDVTNPASRQKPARAGPVAGSTRYRNYAGRPWPST